MSFCFFNGGLILVFCLKGYMVFCFKKNVFFFFF